MWTPDEPHRPGVLKEIKTEMEISEVPTLEVVYDSLVLPSDFKPTEMNIDIQRRRSVVKNMHRQSCFLYHS